MLVNQVEKLFNRINELEDDVNRLKNSKNQKFMPPKATWFEPKPLDGLFFYNIID